MDNWSRVIALHVAGQRLTEQLWHVPTEDNRRRANCGEVMNDYFRDTTLNLARRESKKFCSTCFEGSLENANSI